MAFYLIGLGLNKNSISKEALEALQNTTKIYLENYTVHFPYSQEDLEETLNQKLELADREKVESEQILENASEENIALLVYGNPLMATTHFQLIQSCKEKNIPYKIFHNASILDAVAETGLEIYKFGKITSLPDWNEHTNRPTSFMNYIKENLSISAHTLILIDPSLSLDRSLNQITESCSEEKIPLPENLILLSEAGTEKQEIFILKKPFTNFPNIKKPFCLIWPSKLSSFEERFLKTFSRQL